MAQRLVRRLDDSTKLPYEPDLATLESIQKVVEALPPNVQRPSLEGLKLYKPGSSEENPYGFRGQIAIRDTFARKTGDRITLDSARSVTVDAELEHFYR